MDQSTGMNRYRDRDIHTCTPYIHAEIDELISRQTEIKYTKNMQKCGNIAI